MLQGHLLTQSQRRHKAILGATKMCSICTTRTILKELERLQEKQILTPLGVDETFETCNTYIIAPKPMEQCNHAWTQQGSNRH